MLRNHKILLILTVVLLVFVGCSNDNEDQPPVVLNNPTNVQLANGPQPGLVFLRWNDTGRQRAEAVHQQVDGWCYPGTDAEIEIPEMLGLYVPAGALTQDSLHCVVNVVDTGYSQSEYYPDGAQFADSIAYWVDTTTVQIPDGLTADSIQFYYYNRSNSTFLPIPTVLDRAARRWVAKTVHFSRYIIGQRSGL